MKKLMFAMLPLVWILALSTGGTTPSAAAQPSPPSIGGCRWFCGNNPTAFRTAAACSAVCSSACEAIC